MNVKDISSYLGLSLNGTVIPCETGDLKLEVRSELKRIGPFEAWFKIIAWEVTPNLRENYNPPYMDLHLCDDDQYALYFAHPEFLRGEFQVPPQHLVIGISGDMRESYALLNWMYNWLTWHTIEMDFYRLRAYAQPGFRKWLEERGFIYTGTTRASGDLMWKPVF